MDGWLSSHEALFQRRAPGNTCLSALRSLQSFGDKARNDSKGCGGVMRAAPVGMFMAHWLDGPDSELMATETFKTGCDIAAITHGHPSGILTAGVLALLVALVLKDESLDAALDIALAELRRHDRHEETLHAIVHARTMASQRPGERDAMSEFGEGWVAEETLAIGLYCALSARDFESGIVLAVNHSGDSDSTGSIAGNLLGAMLGQEAIPGRWLAELELREAIGAIADDLGTVREWQLDSCASDSSEAYFYWNRYPGW